MKIETFDFEVKTRIMININNCIIGGSIDEEYISNFDKVFTKPSKTAQEWDINLYRLWVDIKTKVKEYYKKNKELLNKILSFVNEQLNNIIDVVELNKVMVKVKDGKNE